MFKSVSLFFILYLQVIPSTPARLEVIFFMGQQAKFSTWGKNSKATGQ